MDIQKKTELAQKYIAGEVIFIDKYLEWTSFDVVNKIRSLLKYKLGIKKIKVGHAGTLDPLATGLVILCTGKKTKTIQQYQDYEKEYIATIKLGITTPSFDFETEQDNEYPISHITEIIFRKGIKKFLGKQEQIPPIFSAKRVNGKRAYKKARRGEKFELKPSNIEIFEIELLNFELPYAEIRIVCSKGTYIRALARDIGTTFESGAVLSKLVRTRIGDFLLKNAISVDIFEKNI